jgi:hypothetical protein
MHVPPVSWHVAARPHAGGVALPLVGGDWQQHPTGARQPLLVQPTIPDALLLDVAGLVSQTPLPLHMPAPPSSTHIVPGD